MKDGTREITNNQWLLKADADKLPATYAELVTLLTGAGLPFGRTLLSDGWTIEPDPLNKANLLSDTTGSLYGLPPSAVPDDVFSKVADNLNSLKINDMLMMLKLATNSSNIDAWCDLLSDASMVNSGASSNYLLSGGALSAQSYAGLSITSSSIGSTFGATDGPMYVGQTFKVSTTDAIASVDFYLMKIAGPVDSLVVKLYATSVGLPTTLIATSNPIVGATLAQSSGSAVPSAAVTFTFPETVTLVAGTQYALTVERTGAADYTNFYKIAIGTAPAYADGNYIVYTAGAWVIDPGSAAYDARVDITLRRTATVIWNDVVPSEPLRAMAIVASQITTGGTVSWYLSDDGVNWIPILNLQTKYSTEFDQLKVRLKCVITGNASVRAVAWGGM